MILNHITSRSRDPDQVEHVFRRHAIAGIELLLEDLD